MIKFKKIAALLMAAVMLLALAACQGKGLDAPEDTTVSPEATDTPADEPEAEQPAEPATPAYEKLGMKADDVIVTINGEDVTAEEYFYWMDSSYQYLVQNYGEVADWTSMATDTLTIADYLLEDTLESVKFYHLFSTTGAQYGGNEITEADQAEIDQYYQMYITQYFDGEEALQTALDTSIFISMETFRQAHCITPVMYYKVFDALFDSSDYMAAAGEDEVTSYVQSEIIDKDYIHAKHILIRTVDDDREPLSDEEIAAAKVKADDIKAQLDAGADFDTLMNEYSEDTGLASYPDGYYFNDETGFDTVFVEAARALEEGQISDVIEGASGYHIILRLPVEPADFAEEVCWTQYDAILASWREAATVEYSDLYSSIDPSKLY